MKSREWRSIILVNTVLRQGSAGPEAFISDFLPRSHVVGPRARLRAKLENLNVQFLELLALVTLIPISPPFDSRRRFPYAERDER